MTPAAWADAAVGPIPRKEMLEVSRRWGTYAFRALYVAILTLGIWLSLRAGTWGPWGSYSSYALLAAQAFTAISIVQWAAAALAALAFSADLVAREARERTLGLLALTPLSATRIVLGKWIAAMAYVVTVLLLGLPALALCVYLGGVEWGELGMVIVRQAVDAAAVAALTIFMSTSAARVHEVLVRAAVLAAGLVVVEQWALRWAPEFVPRWPDLSFLLPWTPAIHAGIGMLCLGGAIPRIPRLARREGPQVTLRTKVAAAAARREPWWITVLGVRAGLGSQHPLVWKELRFDARWKVLWGMVSVTAFALLLAASAVAWPEDFAEALWWGSPAFLGIPALVLFLLAIAAGSGTFARERERKAWDALLATPLTGREFVRAKLRGVAAALTPWSLGYLFLVGVVAFGSEPPSYADRPSALGGLSVLLFAAFLALLAMFLSLRGSSAGRAFATVTAVGFFLVILPFPVGMCCQIREEGPITFLAGVTNPFYYFFAGMDDAVPTWYIAFYLILYGCATVGLAGQSTRFFDRLAPRAP